MKKQTQHLQVVLITGGTGTIGSQLIDYFLNNNWTVVFTSRSEKKIKQHCQRWASIAPKERLIGLQIDLETETAADQIIDFLLAKNLLPHVLINNARNLDHLQQSNQLLSRDKWWGEFLLDVVVAYELSIKLTRLADSQLYSIINISSIYGNVAANPHLYPAPMQPAPFNYGVSKAGLIQLTKQLAVILAPHTKVNTISYGGVDAGQVNDEFKDNYAKLCPFGRMLAPEEVIAPVKFLADPATTGITGHNLIVDGGWVIW